MRPVGWIMSLGSGLRITRTLFLGTVLVALPFLPVLVKANLPLCAFHGLTGKPCPLCGMTRAMSLLVQGQWKAACELNLLSPLILFLLFGAFLNETLGWICPERLPLVWSRPVVRWLNIGIVICFGSYGILRWVLPI
ncbi:MAG: DUF2752 domain-containing protein [Terriglobia bacterium]